MHRDDLYLPVQKDGDSNDTLQRCAMIETARALGSEPHFVVMSNMAIHTWLQPKRGIYIRHVGGDPKNVSGDQLISVLCAWVAMRKFSQSIWLCFRILMRLGCAQNTRDMYGKSKWLPVPDFILLRALPLMCRIHWIFHPLAWVVDILLVLSALTQAMPVWKDDEGFSKRTPDDVDDNLSVMTFITCRAVMPTPLSYIACKLYAYVRPSNLGNTVLGAANPVLGALMWYHREESGGNPEIAELYEPLVERYLYR